MLYMSFLFTDPSTFSSDSDNISMDSSLHVDIVTITDTINLTINTCK